MISTLISFCVYITPSKVTNLISGLLTDAYLGGDLWSLIYGQKRRAFNEATAQFYTACVVEAFDYLHKRHYCYRDLKPENLMVDSTGFLKIVDFGFTKKERQN